MRNVSLEELLEAGCHFGHQVTRHNPKARDYIFEARDNIHIIDLEKTKEGLDAAMKFVSDLAKRGGTLIVLGAKRQAAPIVKEEVERAAKEGGNGIYFVTNRWIGGILTNFPEVSKNFKRLKFLTERLQNDFEKSKYTKKEVSLWEKERAKLASFYSGIADMQGTPDAVFIIDTHLEQLAVREARSTGVTIVGITDTNADPNMIDYPIPANDDAVGSIKLIASAIVDAWIDGTKHQGKETKEEDSKGMKETNGSKVKAKESNDSKVASGKKEAVKEEKVTKDKKETKTNAVKTSKRKIEETKSTPEKVSVE